MLAPLDSIFKGTTACFSMVLTHNNWCDADINYVGHHTSLFGILQFFTASLVVYRGDNCVRSGFDEGFIFLKLSSYCVFLSQLLLCSGDDLTIFIFKLTVPIMMYYSGYL